VIGQVGEWLEVALRWGGRAVPLKGTSSMESASAPRTRLAPFESGRGSFVESLNWIVMNGRRCK